MTPPAGARGASPPAKATRAPRTSRPGRAEGADAPAYLVRGEDPSLVAQAARALVERLVGERDPALVVEEHGGPSADDLDAGAVVDACTTAPFLVDRRVVVVRDAGRLSAADGGRLAAVLADPLPSVVLVLVGGGGTVPQALVRAVTAVGEAVDTSVRTAGQRRGWLTEQLREGPVRLNADAADRLGAHLGDDLGRLAGILQTLAAAYGEGASVDRERLEPFLGEAGSVPQWDLTEAIDQGDPAAALSALARMTAAGGQPAVVIVGSLHRHFSNMLRLDGADVRSGDEAAEMLGVHPFVGKKALAQCRRLGSERLAQAVGLVADADLDVKGRSGLPPTVVVEVLVARLSRLVRRPVAAGRR